MLSVASAPTLVQAAPPAEADARDQSTWSPPTLKRGQSQQLSLSARKQTEEVTSCLLQLSDGNGSGVIDTKLLTKAMNTIGLPYTEIDLTRELLTTDADGDGVLEVHEFEANLAHQELLMRAGLDGALEPWDLGRCLAMDALPLAARAYTAHCAVDEAIRESELRRNPKRNSQARKAKDGAAATAVAPSPELEQLKRGLRTPLPARAAAPAPAPARPAPAASPRPLSSFSVWEETKADFADYLERRKQ